MDDTTQCAAAATDGVVTNSKPLPLFPAHLTELRASGLNDETIRAAGIYSEHGSSQAGVET